MAALYSLFFLPVASADVPPDLPPARVEAARPVERPDPADETTFATILRRADWSARATSVAEVLRDAAGLSLRAQGTGGLATVSIRGSTPEQVAIFLDGVPLNRAIGGAVNVGDVALSEVERVEIYRGGAPLRLGSAAMGGAINIVTRRPSGSARGEASIFGGSLGTVGGSAVASVLAGALRLDLSAGFERSDGDFQIRSDNGTIGNYADDYLTHRHNNDYAIATNLTRVTLSLSHGFTLALTSRIFSRENGIPSDGVDPSQGGTSRNAARFTTFRAMVSAEATKTNFLAKRLDLRIAPFFSTTRDHFTDPNGSVSAGASDANGRFKGAGVMLDLAYFWGAHQRLAFIADYSLDDASLDDAPHATAADATRHAVRLAFTDELTLATNRLIFSPMVELHLLRDSAALVGPLQGAVTTSAAREAVAARLGVAVRVLPILTLRATVARTFRVPNLTELFGNQGALIGNPSLSPESGVAGDVGLRFAWPPELVVGARGERVTHRPNDERSPPKFSVALAAAYFRGVTENLIQFVQTSSVTAKPFNFGEADLRGVELEASGRAGPLLLTAAYTWTRAVNATPGSKYGLLIPSRPAHALRTRATLSHRPLHVYHELLHLSGNPIDTLNQFELDARNIHSIGAIVERKDTVRFSIEIRNLTNNQVADLYGVPLPGLTLTMRLSALF